jgi:hypothetical protein
MKPPSCLALFLGLVTQSMEAKCLHDFRASSKEELSFEKSSIVKVLNLLTI